MRTGLTRDLGFSAQDRAESVRRASEVSQLFSEAGVLTVVTLISPYRKDRDAARAAHAKRGIPFLEVFLDVPLDVVKARDPKGLYKKVAEGKIKNFTGIDSPYEAPPTPEITLKTHELAVDKCVDKLIYELRSAACSRACPTRRAGLASPDGGELVNLIVPPDALPAKLAEAATLPKVPLTDIDVNWLQVIGEVGGAAQGLHARGGARADAPLQLDARRPGQLHRPRRLRDEPDQLDAGRLPARARLDARADRPADHRLHAAHPSAARRR